MTVDGPKPHGIAHDVYGIPFNATKIPLEESRGKDPLASVMRLVERLQARIGKGEQVEEKGLPLKETRSPEGVRTSTVIGRGEKGGKVQAGDFSSFEKVFFGRFKEGKGLEIPVSGGKFRFLKKAEGEWKAFFQKFLPFNQERRGRSGDLDRVVFRGLLKGGPTTAGERAKEGAAHRTALITDLKFSSGKTEKFARVPVGNLGVVSQILMKIATLVPGDFFSKVLFQQWTGGEDFQYLALSYKIVQPDLAKGSPNPLTESAESRAQGGVHYARESIKGIALSASTEERVARELDLQLRPVGQKGIEGLPVGKKGALFGLFRRRRGGSTETEAGSVFVPWYQLVFPKRRVWKGRPRWYVPLVYFVIASAVGLTLFYLFRFWLQR